MIYHSTRNEQLTASSTHAVLQGIAPDGGLYICDPAALRFDWRAALEKDTLSMAADISAMRFTASSLTLYGGMYFSLDFIVS